MQEWLTLLPKQSRHIFVHDRLGNRGPGPEDYAAAWAMGNSVEEWMRSYFPTYRLEQMRKAQLGMDDYRLHALQQQGQAEADPVAQLVRGEAPAVPRVQRQPAAPPPATHGMQGQMQLLQQQQHQLLAEMQQQRELIIMMQPPQPAAAAAAGVPAGPAASTAVTAPAGAVKPEPQWPELDDEEDWDMFIDLCSASESDFSDSEA